MASDWSISAVTDAANHQAVRGYICTDAVELIPESWPNDILPSDMQCIAPKCNCAHKAG